MIFRRGWVSNPLFTHQSPFRDQGCFRTSVGRFSKVDGLASRYKFPPTIDSTCMARGPISRWVPGAETSPLQLWTASHKHQYALATCVNIESVSDIIARFDVSMLDWKGGGKYASW